MAIETLGAALRQINRLFAEGVVAGLSDAQLLERFLTQGDAGAFEALVGRHGSMVLSVCRGILRDPRDAEDAFQATFLVLVQKGGTIRGRDALGGWLHQVAHRVAIQANAAAARRRTLERQVGQMAVATSTNGPAALDDLLPALHEEIARLPEKYRLAIVLCDLEGMTQAQAAGQLHWSERTLRHRLAEGRARLKRRLARRGLAPDGAMLGAVFLREARAAVPPAWCELTVRAALATVNHAAAAGAVSTAAYKLTQEVFKIMLLQKLKLASSALITVGVTAWAASAALGIDKGEQDAVAVAQAPKTTRPLVLPGSMRLDPTRIARIRARFAPARVVQLAQVWDFSPKTGQAELRDLRPGDSVSMGDLLGVFYSVDVGSRKKDLLDALVQLEQDQKILDEAQKHAEAVPQIFMISQDRAVQGDRNAVNRALNNLKLWDIPQDEIDAVHAEAKKISADKDAWLKTPEGRWVNREKQAAAAKADPGKNEENEDPWGRVTLRSPLDGVVIESNVHKGEMVLDNTVTLFQIADVSRMQVVANCPEDLLPSLEALGSNERQWSVRTVVGAVSATGLRGTIDEIGHLIDPNQHTAVIKGYIDNPGKQIRAGQYVTATVNIPLKQDAVAVAQAPKTTRPLVLPGSSALDPARLARIRARFAPARVIQIAQVWDPGTIEFRELRPGDSVSKGDVLGIFYSVDVGSKKNDLLDALVQLKQDQKVLDEAQKHAEAVPQVFMISQDRAVQGDRKAVNRALNNLKLWDIPQDEIDALRAEAKKISADKDAWLKTPEGRWVNHEKQAATAKADPGKNNENEDPWGRVTLRAPFDGVVVERNVHKDEMVLDNTVTLFQIADVSRLLVIASCPEASLPSLEALGSNERRWSVRTVGAGSATGLPGTIDEIGYLIDPNQHTAVIKGYVDNPGKRIRPGQSVTATVNIPPK